MPRGRSGRFRNGAVPNRRNRSAAACVAAGRSGSPIALNTTSWRGSRHAWSGAAYSMSHLTTV
jgi:hypothetical protein